RRRSRFLSTPGRPACVVRSFAFRRTAAGCHNRLKAEPRTPSKRRCHPSATWVHWSDKEGKRMRKPTLLAPCLVFALSMICAPWSGARGGEPSLNELSMEVAVLQALRQFQLTPAQLETIRKLAKETPQ